MTNSHYFKLLPTLGLSLFLCACNDDSNLNFDPPPTKPDPVTPTPVVTATVSGTAAVGQAITNATVTATCQNGSSFTVLPVNTDNTGKWTGKVDSTQFPCFIEITGGSPDITLASMVFAEGTVNVTPLTHLALVLTNEDINFSWKSTVSQWPTKANIEAALDQWIAALKEKGYMTENLTTSHFYAAFEADGTGWDKVLDNIWQMLNNPNSTIKSFTELTQLAASGDLNTLPSYTSSTTNPPTTSLLGAKNGLAIATEDHTWVMNSPFIPDQNYQASNRHIRASNVVDDKLKDETLFNGEQLLWAQVTLAHAIIGDQSCGTNTNVMIYSVNNDTNPPTYKTWTATECQLNVEHHLGNGASIGSIKHATLVNDIDAMTANISGGEFKIFVHPGIEGTPPEQLPDEIWSSMNIKKGTPELPSGYFLMPEQYQINRLNDGSHPEHEVSINIEDKNKLESREPGTYQCGQDPISSVHLIVDMGFKDTYKYKTKNDGNCTITIDKSGGRKYQGSYSAKLIADKLATDADVSVADRTLEISGQFRNFIIAPFSAANGAQGPLPDGTAGMSITIDDGNTHFTQGNSFLLIDDKSEKTGHIAHYDWVDESNPLARLRMTVGGLPLSIGSYLCNETVGDQQLSMSLATSANMPYNSTTPAETSCVFDVKNVAGGIVEGSYTATLTVKNAAPVFPDNDASITISGEFRHEYEDTSSASEAVEAADLGENSDPTKDEFITLMSKTWPVVIYQAPEENPQWYGKGSITYSGTANSWNIKLVGADGSTITELNSDGAITNALSPFYKQDLGVTIIYQPGQIFINKGVAIDQFLTSFIEWNTGLIEGSAGGHGEVKFRNSLLAYGATVPSIFNELAGLWSANVNVYCSGAYGPATPVTNTASITADGKITLDGKTQLCGNPLPQTFQWGGYDDFLIPGVEESDGAFLMHIDAQDFSNVSAGKVQIRFDENMKVEKMSGFLPEYFELKGATKQ